MRVHSSSAYQGIHLFVLCSLNNKPESSRHFTIFLMSFISSFDVTSVVVPDPEAPDPITFLWIPVSAAVNSMV